MQWTHKTDCGVQWGRNGPVGHWLYQGWTSVLKHRDEDPEESRTKIWDEGEAREMRLTGDMRNGHFVRKIGNLRKKSQEWGENQTRDWKNEKLGAVGEQDNDEG